MLKKSEGANIWFPLWQDPGNLGNHNTVHRGLSVTLVEQQSLAESSGE